MNIFKEIREGVYICSVATSSGNAIILNSDAGLIVIDTFLLPKDSKFLLENVKKLGKKIYAVINTHWHSDHCFGNRFFSELTENFFAHKEHWNTLVSEKNVLKPSYSKNLDKKKLVFPTTTIEKDIVLDVGREIHLIMTPGHTRDSISVYLPSAKIIIAGDTILNSLGSEFAVPYFYWGNHLQQLNSLQKISSYDLDLIIPGHGKTLTKEKAMLGIEYLTNLNLIFNDMKKNKICNKIIINELTLEKCLPKFQKNEFWIPVMHEMNLKNLIDKKNK